MTVYLSQVGHGIWISCISSLLEVSEGSLKVKNIFLLIHQKRFIISNFKLKTECHISEKNNKEESYCMIHFNSPPSLVM